MRRGAILILGAVLSATFASAATAQGRFVQACEIAILAHAGDLEIQFPQAELVGNEARVSFSFTSAGATHSGEAVCGFREEAEPHQPPSLARFEVLGRSSPAMFLVAHHAVWEHFTGGANEETAATPVEVPEEEPSKDKPSRRRMIAAAGD